MGQSKNQFRQSRHVRRPLAVTALMFLVACPAAKGQPPLRVPDVEIPSTDTIRPEQPPTAAVPLPSSRTEPGQRPTEQGSAAALVQPRDLQPNRATARRNTNYDFRRSYLRPLSSRLTSYTARRRRLARAPDMLGDTLLPPAVLTLDPQNIFNGLAGTVQLAVAGGSSRVKISEHNKALPVDRFYANYNHFHNAAKREVFSPGLGDFAEQRNSVDRFTLGLERTIQDGSSSIEVRLPLTSYPDLVAEIAPLGPAGQFVSDTGTLGNVSLIGKRLLVDSDDLVVSAGIGVELPTGDDASALTGTTLFELHNETVYLQPFFAATLDNGDTFIHSFVQIDIDTGGNPLLLSDIAVPGPASSLGRLQQETLIHWDTSIGHWLARSEDETGITGIAAICEFHLTATASDGDVVSGFVPTIGGPVSFALESSGRQLPATYFTTGLHVELAKDTTLRVAGVFPLASNERRLFDTELLVQVGRRY